MRFRAPVVPLLLALSLSIPAFALPGDAAAVMQHCGAPKSEEQMTSPVTNRLERNLYYADDVILHFQPSENGWSFTSAWDKHFPMTREMLEARMPCFRNAMKEAESQPLPYIDPSIAQQTTMQPVDPSTFGIANFWLIAGLIVILALFFILVPAARRRNNGDRTEGILRKRFLRKPKLVNQKPLSRRRLTEIEEQP